MAAEMDPEMKKKAMQALAEEMVERMSKIDESLVKEKVTELKNNETFNDSETAATEKENDVEETEASEEQIINDSVLKEEENEEESKENDKNSSSNSDSNDPEEKDVLLKEKMTKKNEDVSDDIQAKQSALGNRRSGEFNRLFGRIKKSFEPYAQKQTKPQVTKPQQIDTSPSIISSANEQAENKENVRSSNSLQDMDDTEATTPVKTATKTYENTSKELERNMSPAEEKTGSILSEKVEPNVVQPVEEVPSPAKPVEREESPEKQKSNVLETKVQAQKVVPSQKEKKRINWSKMGFVRAATKGKNTDTENGPAKEDLKETIKPKKGDPFVQPESLELLLVDMTFPINVDEFNEIFFQKNDFHQKLLEKSKHSDITFQNWSDTTSTGSKREHTYTMKRMGMSPNTVYINSEYKQAEHNKGYQVDQIVTTPEVPYGKAFYVHSQIVLAAKGDSTHVHISQNVELQGKVSAIAKNFIRKMSKSETMKYYDQTWKPFTRRNLISFTTKSGGKIPEAAIEEDVEPTPKAVGYTRSEVLLFINTILQFVIVLLLAFRLG